MTSDTPQDVQAKFDALIRGRTGDERVRMMSEMFELAKELIASNVRAAEPAISEAELRVRVFERLYADDVDAETLARVAARIRAER